MPVNNGFWPKKSTEKTKTTKEQQIFYLPIQVLTRSKLTRDLILQELTYVLKCMHQVMLTVHKVKYMHTFLQDWGSWPLKSDNIRSIQIRRDANWSTQATIPLQLELFVTPLNLFIPQCTFTHAVSQVCYTISYKTVQIAGQGQVDM